MSHHTLPATAAAIQSWNSSCSSNSSSKSSVPRQLLSAEEQDPTTMSRRLAYAEALLDIVTNMVEIMWQGIFRDVELALPASTGGGALRTYLREVLKRSQTGWTTAQMAVQYLFQTQRAIRRHLQRHRGASIVCCARRMFLAALIVASKFVQDKTYRNSAWATIARLPVREVNLAERVFLDLCQYRLYIPPLMFADLHRVLCAQVAHALRQPPDTLVSLQDVSFAHLSSTPSPAQQHPSPLLQPPPPPPQCTCRRQHHPHYYYYNYHHPAYSHLHRHQRTINDVSSTSIASTTPIAGRKRRKASAMSFTSDYPHASNHSNKRCKSTHLPPPDQYHQTHVRPPAPTVVQFL
ncbi:hypothetical protein RO3G_08728 [Lichtheimia corymbifera JMRC:FSU:9682]|uniref:Cyclin N-terminal domain-containing protein n=1 Tax=Lichtheimia corymbifera JMRC:FSU:9682 TaxID=1263082 RepID=A0A068RKH1_9FUNG|nr:hypothetical protein RO3G_08728 [Lichtheimia corymbifera JMRC:FSU:9682]